MNDVTPKDIPEMLDALESALERLWAERSQLVSALEEAERRLRTPGRKPAKKKASRKRAVKAKVKATATAVPEPPPAEAVAAGDPAARPAPKRQALGRGLSQLRRVPAG